MRVFCNLATFFFFREREREREREKVGCKRTKKSHAERARPARIEKALFLGYRVAETKKGGELLKD